MEEESKLNMCRVCMAEGNELQSIFSTDDRCGPNMRLAEIIMSYASVQITVGDGLPENICSECADSAALFYIFKIKCEETDDKLRLNLVKSPSVSIDEPFDDIKSESQQTSDGKESAVKPQDYETLKAILNNLPIPETSPEVESQEENIVVEPEDLLMPIDDCVESVEVVASDTVDPLMDLKTEYDSSSTTSGRVDSDEKRKFHCKICDKNFLKNSHLTRHKKIHSLVKAHSCTLCHKSFARPEQLANHLNVHSGIKPHVCVDCGKGFNQLSNLKDHMRTHNGEKPFLCSTCGKGFNQLGNLRQHTVRHSGIKAHVCTTCGSGFASKGELCAHVRKHTGARPFVCPICEHGFTTSSSLTKHKRIHSGEKPYECEVCKMKFSRSGILARHMRTHTGEKPYVCHHCSRAFSQSNDLSSHLRIHTGEKPYICDVCGQAFRQTSALKTHKRTHMNKSVLSSNVVINMMRDRFLDSLQVLPSEACNTT